MAYEAYMKCKFNKQGASKGESPKKDRKDWISVLAFNFEVQSPRDAATGQASGKRQYKPVRFLKEWGAASPQLMTACARNETLDTVNFEFITHTGAGAETVYYTITLTNATVSAVAMFTGEETGAEGAGSSKHTKDVDTLELERISLTFSKIEANATLAKTTFMDDWREVNA
jgi:type VI secretion system secreted protein Hcp